MIVLRRTVAHWLSKGIYNEANEENPERHINMVILAQRRYALELFEDNADGESSTANTSGG